MAITPRRWREDLSRSVGDWETVVTSGAGNAGGTTYPSTSRDGYGGGATSNFYRSFWSLSQTLSEYRIVTTFNGATPATFTVTPAYSAQIAASATLELHVYRPDLYAEAAKRAIRKAWPFLHLPTLDDTTVMVADDFDYPMPGGILATQVTQVMMEGSGNFDNVPYHAMSDVTYSPDSTRLWLNRGNHHKWDSPVIADRKLYIFAMKYLTPFPDNPTYGTLVNDTTPYIELDEMSPQYELLLLYGKASLYEILGEQPANSRRDEHRALAQAALVQAERQRNDWRMPLPENPYVA